MMKRIGIATCVGFTLMMVCYLAAWFAFGGLDQYLVMFLSILLASVFCATIQAIWFYSPLVKNMRYIFRSLWFALSLFLALLLCAWVGNWFPMNMGSLLGFTTIFLVIFATMAIGYSIYFKKVAGSYEQALKAYREK